MLVELTFHSLNCKFTKRTYHNYHKETIFSMKRKGQKLGVGRHKSHLSALHVMEYMWPFQDWIPPIRI